MPTLANLLLTANSGSDKKQRDDKTAFSTMSHGSWKKAIELWLRHGLELLAARPQRACPACGSGEAEFLYTSHDGHPFHRCKECLCWFEPYLVDEKLFREFFASCPEAGALAEEMAQERLNLPAAYDADQERFAQLLDFLNIFPSGALLDIGANAGQFVAAAQEHGWNAWGLENDVFALEAARARGRQVVNDISALPDEKWNMVTLWETIEHVADPLGLLGSVEKNLARGGVIALTFPNLNNLNLQQMRGNCPYSHGGYNTAGHINFFGVEQFKSLLNRAGLEPVFWEGLYSSDYVMQWGYLHGKTIATDIGCELADGGGFEYPAILEELSPGLAFMERRGLTSPILLCIACRGSEKELLREQIEHLDKKRLFSLEKQGGDLLLRYGLVSSSGRTLSFRLHQPAALKVLFCGNNSEPEQVGALIKNVSIAPAGKLSPQTGQPDSVFIEFVKAKKRYGLCSDVLKFKQEADKSIALVSKKVKYETLVCGQPFTLSPGEYSLTVDAEILMGRAAIGLLNCETEEWFLDPVDLGMSENRNGLSKFLGMFFHE